jgi:CDP-glucose 4,6-dehydratase
MNSSIVDTNAWHEKRVLVTGHTGFKGSWLSLWLDALGAEVFGLSDQVQPAPALFAQADLEQIVDHSIADVRNVEAVHSIVERVQPDVVFHLAAQPFVRRSFREPLETYGTNVMGTANVLDVIRRVGGVKAVVAVTSDKCYDNDEQQRPFVETDPMGGHDPYSNSKGAAELVTDAFRRSYFSEPGTANIASARAGNVIGGGDWGEDRLIPDIMRAVMAGEPVQIRRPDAVRPWQHVLNPLSGYIVLAQALIESGEQAQAWNFGPSIDDAKPVSFLVERLAELWPTPIEWEIDNGDHPHEAHFLSLDSSKARELLGWRPGWDLDAGVDATVAWFTSLLEQGDMRALTLQQIAAFEEARR